MQPLILAMDHEPKFLRHLRRRANQVFARWLPQPARFVYGPQYQFAWPGMPIDEVRGERVLTALAAEGLLRREHIRQPPLASYHAILRVHADAYIESAQTAATMSQIVGMPVSDRDTQRILDLQRSMTGGTMLATDIALSTGDLAINLGGGFHHARPAAGRGFCVFNDVAVAIAEQRALGFHGKVLVIDLDMHDGDGTRAIFAADASVHTLSIHSHDWDTAPALESTRVALGDDVDDTTYLDAVRTHVSVALRQFRPKLVYFLAGVDGAADDPLGDWSLSDDTLQARDEAVFELLRHLAPEAAVVVTLAGGYGHGAWRHYARSFAWLQSGHHGFRPPATDELTLMRARHLAKLLREEELTGRSTNDLGLTLEDVMPGHGSQESRLLGYYSRQGLELALERHGFLDRAARASRHRPSSVTSTTPAARRSPSSATPSTASGWSSSCCTASVASSPASSCCRSTGCCCRTRASASARPVRACPGSNCPAWACSRSSSRCWWSPASASAWPACWSRRRSFTSRCNGSDASAASRPATAPACEPCVRRSAACRCRR